MNEIEKARWFVEGWVRVSFTIPEWNFYERRSLRRPDGKLISTASINRRIKRAMERHNEACCRADRHDDCIFYEKQTTAWRNRE